MGKERPHARVFDLPGWPCPPRVRDIPRHQSSWGRIGVIDIVPARNLAQDDLGYLWVNGDTVPRFTVPDDSWEDPGAVVFWTETGVGLWVHPKSLRHLHSISRLDMKPDQWLPVNEVAREMPPFVKAAV